MIYLLKICLAGLFLFQSGSFAESDDCAVTFRAEVAFGYHRKMVNGNAFPKGEVARLTAPNQQLTDGSLEICLQDNGDCKWSFQAKNASLGKNFSIRIPGLDDVTKYLSSSNTSLDQFIEVVKSKGGIVSDIGNKTLSIRLDYPNSGRTVITLVDQHRGRIIGSSVYQNDRKLEAKLICNYSPDKQIRQPEQFIIHLFEHQLGEPTGWATEVIVRQAR